MLTDLTIPRRQVVALNFANTTAIPGTGIASVMYAHSNQTQYPVISASNANVSPDNPGVDLGTEPKFGFLALKEEQEFGIFFPASVEASVRTLANSGFGVISGSDFLLSMDASSINTEGYDYPIGWGHRTLPADLTAYELTTSYFPLDAQIQAYTGTGFVPSAHFAPVYTFGTGILARQNPGDDLYVSNLAGTWKKAFQCDGDFAGLLTGPVTTNDATWNYTLCVATPESETGNTLFLSKWKAVDPANPFDFTNYRIVLEEAEDDAILQAGADYDFDFWFRVRGNTTNAFITIDNASDWTTAQTVFFFAEDFSWYDRLDITTNGDLGGAVYFRDIDGIQYLVGTNISNGQSYQLLGPSPAGDVDEDVRLRVWGYSLDGHDYYVLRLGTSETLVYDLTTGQWSEWQSPSRDNWRPHVGQNWIGMVGDTLANGSDIVCGDDVTGTLYILDPACGQDEHPTTGEPAPFPRIVTGGLRISGRDTLPCGALQVDLSLGNPALTRATVNLRTSDDLGHGWTSHGSQAIVASVYSQNVEWRGLGLAKQPGRIFSIEDNGVARISSASLR